MTREKAVNEYVIPALKNTWNEKVCAEVINTLEQEPCEYAISRQSAIFLANDLKEDLPDDEHIADMVLAHNEGILEYQTKLSLLPPVTPQPKTGRWIIIDDCEQFIAKCSECGRIEDSRDISKYPYCHCGARMQEVEE